MYLITQWLVMILDFVMASLVTYFGPWADFANSLTRLCFILFGGRLMVRCMQFHGYASSSLNPWLPQMTECRQIYSNCMGWLRNAAVLKYLLSWSFLCLLKLLHMMLLAITQLGQKQSYTFNRQTFVSCCCLMILLQDKVTQLKFFYYSLYLIFCWK